MKTISLKDPELHSLLDQKECLIKAQGIAKECELDSLIALMMMVNNKIVDRVKYLAEKEPENENRD